MNRLNKPQEYDSYEIEEPSDEERAEDSSEDELEVLLNGTADQKRKLIREYLTGESESSSGDEFEKEMEAELSSTIKTMEGTWAPAAPAADSSGTNGNATTPALPAVYDPIYFDTDSEEEEDAPSSSTGRRRKQRTIPTNDELLYDPDEDDRDQAWVDAKRRGYGSDRRRQRVFGPRGQKSNALPSSDAVLNCPACMTTLCLDCQRHDKYRTQYRAMFVMNCSVNKEEVLRYKAQSERKRKNRKRRRGQQEEEEEAAAAATTTTTTTTTTTESPLGPRGMDGEEVYHPVQCTECSTEVAVFDKDEVYHFFNILASHC